MTDGKSRAREIAFSSAEIPPWALRRPKSLPQAAWDLVAAPLRMVLLPDGTAESMHLTSLRGERFAAVLPRLHGRVLDIGAGDNMLIKLYRRHASKLGVDPKLAAESVGVDTTDWGADCIIIIKDSAALPFPDARFDTVCLVACLNHITNRRETLTEARRVLRPGGKVVITMIGPLIGTVGHAIWWYSEDKHRDVHPDEQMGMSSNSVRKLLDDVGFTSLEESGFCYRLNHLFVATAPGMRGDAGNRIEMT